MHKRLKFALLSILMVILSSSGRSATSMSQDYKLYQRVEETITWKDHNLDNPFVDVELRLSITAPDSRSLDNIFDFFGFYAGDGIGGQYGDKWKFRILLDTPGEWEVTARFYSASDGAPKEGAPEELKFFYNVLADTVEGEHGHVQVDPGNPSRLAFADGTSWVPFSIHSSMLLDREFNIAKQWINEHSKLGVNALAVRFHSEVEEIGEVPAYHFLDKDGRRANTWPSVDGFDYQKFDLKTWFDNERIINYAHEKGLKLSVWFGISGINSQYNSYGAKDNPTDNQLGLQQELFIKYFLARWAAYTVWWHWTIDSEYEETGNGALARVRAYAKEMHRLNPWRTLLTTHVLDGWSPKDAPEFDLATLQRRVPDDVDNIGLLMEFIDENSGYGMPVYNSEGVWNLSDVDKTRVATIAHLMGVGYSHVAHDFTDHKKSSWGVTWDTVTDRHKEDAVVLGQLALYFNSGFIDINRMIPCQGLIAPQFGITNIKERFYSLTNRRIDFCLQDEDQQFLIWLPRGGAVSINLGEMHGQYEVSRYAGKNLQEKENLGVFEGGKTLILKETPTTGLYQDYFYLINKLGG